MDRIELTIEQWEKIQDRLAWLDALEAAGVDNWEGGEEAMRIYRETCPDDED